jgi:Galactosyltransferase
VKVLIAIKAGRTLSYTRWESTNSPSFNPAIAYKNNGGGNYDDGEQPIHVSGPNPRLAAVRETWLKDAIAHPEVTAKFFFGKSDVTPAEDEVNLPVPDDYANLAPKTLEILKWSVANGFDYSLLCDDDTIVYVDRLVAEIKTTPDLDYGGHQHGNVCTGGPGYIVSKKAAEAVIRNFHQNWAEDVSVAKSLYYEGFKPVNLIGHRSGKSNHHFFTGDQFDPNLLDAEIVTAHAVFPQAMRDWYRHKNDSAKNG